MVINLENESSASLRTGLNNFLTHLQLRINLWNQNTALILERENLLSRQHLLIQEKEKLLTSNKIHNFTSINLPSEFTELLNKGTNFIPNSDKINISAIKNTISSEINSTLCQIIEKGSYNSNTCPHTLKRKRPTLDISLTPRRNPLNKLLHAKF